MWLRTLPRIFPRPSSSLPRFRTLRECSRWRFAPGGNHAAHDLRPRRSAALPPLSSRGRNPMPSLTPPSVYGDPTLEECLRGNHRMMRPQNGPAVKKVQEALIDVGYALPRFGADGSFGQETADAVVAFKTNNRISPNDP